MVALGNTLLEISYIIIGLQFLHTAYRVFRDDTNPVRVGTGFFWGLIGITFIGGSFLPNKLVGIIVVVLALLTLFKQVDISKFPPLKEEVAEARASKIGNAIFYRLS